MQKLVVISGIYQIVNTINFKSYIGSAKHILYRWTTHRQQLNHGSHHNLHLQRAWSKYGEQSFKFIVLEDKIIGHQNLLDNEKSWIELLKPEYNIGSVGGGDNISKHPKNDEFREKQRLMAQNRYKNMTDEEKKKLSRIGETNPNWKGGISKPKCIGCGKLISATRTRCQICSKQGDLNSFYGKHHSEKTKEKIRQKKLGKPNTAQAIKVSINGVIYPSMAEAARQLGIHDSLLTYRFKKNYPGYFKL